jgi:hypothetical protein
MIMKQNHNRQNQQVLQVIHKLTIHLVKCVYLVLITNLLKVININNILSLDTPLSSPDLSNISEEERALNEIIQAYLKNTKIGWTKSFDFYKVLKKYEPKSREILITLSTIRLYSIMK